MASNEQGGRKLRLASVFLIIALASLDALLIFQNVKLKKEVNSGTHSMEPPIGGHVPDLSGVGADGRRLSVSFGAGAQRATFIFAYSAGCLICSRSWPAWSSLLRTADTRRVKLEFIDLGGGVTGFPVSEMSNQNVFVEVDPKVAIALNLRLVPEIFEISPGGVLLDAWPGELDSNGLKTLKRALGISPEASPDPAVAGSLP